MVEHRSVSQYKDYAACPYRYYLQRVQRAWSRPAAWLPQGTAVHAAAEAWERSGRRLSVEQAQQVYRDEYERGVNELADDTPNLTYWFGSGPRYPGPDDVERRFAKGLEQVDRYVTYYTRQHPEEVIWITPDGTPAIELEFGVDLGGVEVRGFIDQVIMPHTQASPVVRDIKSGRQPGDEFQLATYARALEQTYDIEITTGDYWMGVSGKPTIPYDLTGWSADRLGDEYAKVDDGIRAERFDPAPEADKCRFCPVANACSFAA
ncbi:RecB family exonuclease [Amycolatopsis cihanbeyliensis]|uniref:Putative RecB family exonuclease n=1 Tax=Amycolatopsis cihanbeyliensis TaxID=1128664 RepID=A0A542DNX3_AMYCI|nr:PD-(D/E)XK nuclease family protein [Amycolatopsis cihanbeyliensis]TQJ04665.1 putative RecB family exonuclease [Amycolatopsis cihanbeyliensis]